LRRREKKNRNWRRRRQKTKNQGGRSIHWKIVIKKEEEVVYLNERTTFSREYRNFEMKQQQQPLDASSRRKNMETTEDSTAVVDRWLSSMTLEDKIGQMSQIDINMLLENDEQNGGKKRLQLDQVKHFIGEMGVGSVLNTVSATAGGNNPVAYWTALDYRRAMIQIHQVAQEYQRPPVIWGLDSVHGANYIHGAIVTPQPLNLAATFNRSVAYHAGVLASRDTRAAGINWLFSPLLGIALEPLWSRVYETYGEDMLVVAEMARYTIAGIQNITTASASSSIASTKPSRAAACAKHFVGYSMPRHGHDRSPSWIPTRHLYQYFVPPWIKALTPSSHDDGSDHTDNADIWIPKTVMESYTETDGLPNVANPQTLQYLLRQRLAYDGVLVTDYSEIYNLNSWHHIVDGDASAVVIALSQGTVDMSMIPWKAQDFVTQVVNAVQQQQQQQQSGGSCSGNGGISEARIDISARRVLQLKHDLNMFQEDESFALQESDPALHLIGTDVDAVMDMVHQSIILTKNDDNFLPLDDNPQQQQHLQILVTGPTSASRSYQSGGWTGQWQGVPTNDNNGGDDASWFTYGSTVLQAFSAQPGWDVSYTCGTNILGGECSDDDKNLDQNMMKSKNKNHRNVNVVEDVNHVVEDVKSWIGLSDDLPKNSIERAVVAAASMDVVVICVGEEAVSDAAVILKTFP
jgi:beta-glucosidase